MKHTYTNILVFLTVKGELGSFFRRFPLPWNQKQRTYETTKNRIQDGKTRYMLRRVVSHFCC